VEKRIAMMESGIEDGNDGLWGRGSLLESKQNSLRVIRRRL